MTQRGSLRYGFSLDWLEICSNLYHSARYVKFVKKNDKDSRVRLKQKKNRVGLG
jgi:hypothetical protein